MSRQFDAKNAALTAYPDDKESAVNLFQEYIDMDTSDIEYELGMSIEEYIYGKEPPKPDKEE